MRQLPADAATFRSYRVRIDPHLIGIGVDPHKEKEEAQNELPLESKTNMRSLLGLNQGPPD